MQEGAISMFKLWSVKTTIILRRQSRCRHFRDNDQEEYQEKLDAKGDLVKRALPPRNL